MNNEVCSINEDEFKNTSETKTEKSEPTLPPDSKPIEEPQSTTLSTPLLQTTSLPSPTPATPHANNENGESSVPTEAIPTPTTMATTTPPPPVHQQNGGANMPKFMPNSHKSNDNKGNYV